MEISAEKLRLYAVADCARLNGHALVEAAKDLLAAGVTCFEMEAGPLSEAEFEEQARELLPLCRRLHVPFLVRNSIEAVQRLDADGVRLDWSETKVAEARRALGMEKIVGASAHCVREAILARRQGADFLVCGSVFGSSLNDDVAALERPELWRICKAADVPVVAAGGITLQNAPLLIATGVAGIAVSRGLFGAPNRLIAGHTLRTMAERICAYQEEPPIINYRWRNR